MNLLIFCDTIEVIYGLSEHKLQTLSQLPNNANKKRYYRQVAYGNAMCIAPLTKLPTRKRNYFHLSSVPYHEESALLRTKLFIQCISSCRFESS